MVTLKPNGPSYIDEIRKTKQEHQKGEKLWQTFKLAIHQQLNMEHCREFGQLLIK